MGKVKSKRQVLGVRILMPPVGIERLGGETETSLIAGYKKLIVCTN